MKPATLLTPARILLALALAATACGAPPDAPAPAPAPTSPHAYVSASLTPGCGNGVLEPELGEVCDDGNPYDLDGCGSTCLVDVGYVCVGERPSVCSSPDESDGPEALGNAKHSRFLPPVSPFTGQDFWTGFPKNLDTPTALGLKIAGDPGATYTVTDTSGTSLASGTIPASGIASVTVTVATYQITTNGSATNQGIHVTASSSVRVLATSESMYTTDTWAVWSTDKLGLDYRMMTVPGRSGSRLQILFVGTKAGTTATLRDTAGTVRATLNLGLGQTYLYNSGSTSTAGWTLTSNHPVAVIPGSECENLGGACDLVGEQLAPVKNWAKDYVVGPTFFKATVDAKHMVFARDDDTAIVITRNDGVITNLTLNAGQTSVFLDSIGAGAFGYLVTADKPIAIGSLVSDQSSSWDVSLVYWPPIDGYVASAKMPTSGYAVSYTNYLTLTARTAATSYLRVNGAAVAGWTEIASTGFSYTRVAVPNGDNEITASGGVKFGAVASGGASSVSYAYASPYDIASVGGTTNCYLGTTPPDYETELAPSAGADADDLSNVDDEDALTFPTSLPMNAASPSLTIPCNDNYFGVDATATVHGWIDFDRDGAFSAAEHASAFCDDATPYSNGSAVLTWGGLTYTTTGLAAVRLRVCDNTSTCDSPTGDAFSGEVEDHQLHVGVCGDGFLDTFDLCDDGGTAAGDGCSATCTVEAGFACSGNPSVCLLTQAPELTSPPNGTLTNDNTPDLGGTCVAGSTVRVLEAETVLCSSSCATGTFGCTSSALADGARALTADQQIGAHRSVRSAVLVVNVDTAAPNGPVISTPGDGAVLADTTPRVTGTCEPGAVVTVRENATSLCTATCTAASTFACDTSALSQGAHVLIARQVDVGGNSSADGNAVTVTLDTSAPAVPVITVPAAGATVNDATPNVSGTCETGSTVKVYEGLTQLCSSPCVGSAFACDTVLLANGAHTIAPRQTDAAGNSSPFGAMVAFTLNAPPVQPVITVPTEGALVAANPSITMSCQPGNTIKLREGATELCSATCAASVYSCQPALTDGAHAVVAWQISPAALVGPDSATRSFTVDGTTPGLPVIASPAAGGVTNDAQPTFAGSCESDATVQVYDGATLLCQSVCAASTFACTSGTAYPEQLVTVKARQRDAAGNQGAYTVDHTFRIVFDSTPPDAPVLTAPLASAVLNDATPDITGSCETDAFVEVFEGATPVCTTTCVASAFACESIARMDGAHTFTAQQTDPAGNLSMASAGRTFAIDTVPPVAATITTPVAAAVLSDATPTIAGDCETGATVTVREGATVLCSATCAASVFSCDAASLGEGAHTAIATQVDAAGNAGPASAARSFTIDTLVPAPPAISTPLAGALLSDTTPTVTGLCETGATVTVREGATVRCSASCPAGAFSCDSTVLTEGAHTFTATQVDAASNSSASSAARAFEVDSIAPAVATILAPTAAAVLSDATPTFSGACETGATVTVREGATVLCAATCAGAAYTCDSAALAEGDHAVTATQVDPTGNASAASAARSFTVDTVAPAAPGITTPLAASTVPDTTPTVTGTCETGAMVTVREGATVRCSITCVAAAFSCDSSLLGEGAHSFTATQVDAASNSSAASAARAFSVDSIAPLAPVVQSPVEGALVATATPTLSGSCEAGTTVTVSEGATTRCSASCDGGSFSCVSGPLAEGARAISATQADAAGNVSAASLARGFVVDTVAPLAPVVLAPLAGALLTDPTPTLSGSCESGANVELFEGAAALCSALCVDGGFSCTTPTLADGGHVIVAQQTDPAGNGSTPSAGRAFTVDTIAPLAPLFTLPAEGAFLSDSTPLVSGTCESDATVEILEGALVACSALCVDGAFSCSAADVVDGPHTFTARQTDASGNQGALAPGRTFTVDTAAPAAPAVLRPLEAAQLSDVTPTLSGSCESAATVELFEGATLLCSAPCVDGAFACDASELAQGAHLVTATQRDRAGNVGPGSIGLGFGVDTIVPDAPLFTTPEAGALLATTTPTVTGACETGATVRLFEAALLLCTTTCDAGVFSCTAPALAEGDHTLTARQTDAAGNESLASSERSFTVDTIAPALVVIDTPADGALLAVATATLGGDCETGASVQLLEDVTVACTATCTAARFSCDATALADGTHTFTARQTDATGNLSGVSLPISVVVDTTAPEAAVIDAPLAGAFLPGASPAVAGLCESGATVEVREGALTLCVAPCVGAAFECVSSALVDGPHTFTVRQTDPAGNVGPDGAPVTVTIDTTLPVAPAILSPVAGLVTREPTLTVSGSCESDATVEVSGLTGLLCSAPCVDGGFSCVTPTLTEGAHTLVATQRDLAGNQGPASAEVAITADRSSPTTLTATGPVAGALLGDATPTVTGTCETGATVEVREGANLLCSAPCVAGAFSCTTGTLADGSHTLSLTQRDPAGNEGTPVTVAGVVIDTTAPTGPAITSPTAAQQLADASPTVQGFCETGATVELLEGATVLCTTTCALGNFQCDATTLSDGPHTFTTRQTDRAGNRSANGPGVQVVIDTAAPGLPTVASPLEDVVYDVDTVLVSGSCESLSLVEVLEGQLVLCSALCVDGAFSCDAGPLAEGSHDVVTRQTDRAGNVGAPTLPVSFAVDTLEPIAPVVTAPAADARLADTSPTFEGDCESGATVRVLEGESVLCSALCVAGGFTCEATELTDGVHVVTTRQLDAGGNDSPESAEISFEIDTTAPLAPTFVRPVDGETLTDATPTFEGTAEPFASITVTEDAGGTTNAKPGDVVHCTAQVDADGAWSCDAMAALADGPHVVEATATDALGNVGALTAIVGFELDTSAPLAPTLLAPAAGETVGRTATFGGLAQPGVTVEVRVDDAVVCTAVADRTGAFACVADAALGLGAHTAVANALDEAGNRSGSSAEVGFTVADGVAPGAPVFSSPTQDGATPDGQPTFAGRAEPGATVEVRIDGAVVCTATADETGAFACEASLPEGSYVATATARNEAGESVASLPLRFVIDQTAPAAPTLTTPADDGTVGTRPLFAGTAEAGTVVTVTVDGAPVCAAIVDGAGRWSCQAVETLGAGAHVAVASATDEAGNVSAATSEVAFDVALDQPPVATIVRPVEGSTLSTSTVLFAGLADPGSRVVLTLDARPGCEAIAAGNGAFACTMTEVADGPHVATATASNDRGTGSASPWVTFLVDTTAPLAPVLVTPEEGATTNAWPRFEGTAEAQALVQVTLDGRALCVAEADGDGAFSCSAARPLAIGAHVAAAIAYDGLGLASPASEPRNFTVSIQVPAILSPVDDALLADSTPEVTGTAQPGHALRVVVGEVVGCTTTVTEAGTFACTIDPALADGVYTLVAVAADGFGAELLSPEQALTIDTTAPAAPTLTSPEDGEQVIGETTTFSGEGEPGSTITVEVDGETACTAVVAADGTWSCEAILTEGTHEVTVTAEDAAGNVSTTSGGTTIETAAALPKPIITAPKSGEEFQLGEVGVAGTTLARASVKVTDDLGQTLCTVTADAEGVFSCTARPVPGERTIRAVATVGQQASPASDPVTFTVFDDVGFAGGGVGCGCTTGSGAATGLWALVVFAFFGLRRRRTVK